MQHMSIKPITIEQLPQLLELEKQAFVPTLWESEQVFRERILCFPDGVFFLMNDSKPIGYMTSELWSALPPDNLESLFKLNHSPLQSHVPGGEVLYLSSFMVDASFKGRGLGKKFFKAALDRLKKENPQITCIVLLVNELWKGAISIYTSCGFVEIKRIPRFFNNGNSFSDGIIMKKVL